MAFFGSRPVADESSLLGSLRVAVVGEPSVGKTALTELIANGRPAKGSPRSTAGAHIYVKLVDRAQHQQDPTNEAQRRFFVELWDVSGQQKYEQLRPVFYKQLNGEQALALNGSNFMFNVAVPCSPSLGCSCTHAADQ